MARKQTNTGQAVPTPPPTPHQDRNAMNRALAETRHQLDYVATLRANNQLKHLAPAHPVAPAAAQDRR